MSTDELIVLETSPSIVSEPVSDIASASGEALPSPASESALSPENSSPTDALTDSEAGAPPLPEITSADITAPSTETGQRQQRSAKKKKPAARPAPGETSAQKPSVSYLPADILARMGKNDALRKTYLEEARQLALNIRQWGLGQALCLLQTSPQRSCGHRLYRDLTRWLLKEHKLKARRNQGLMESIVYGQPLYLLQATHGALLFVDKLLRVPAPPRKQRSSQTAAPTVTTAISPETPSPAPPGLPDSESPADTVSEEIRSNPTHD